MTKVFYLIFLFCFLVLSTQLKAQGMISQEFDDQTEAKLSKEQIDVFKKQALNSVTDLSRHITILIDKANEIARRSKSVEMAILLFSSEENIIKTSSAEGEKKTIKIRSYFNKLKALPYSNIKITWYDIYISSTFKQGIDGKYYGVATIFQKFEGSNNNEVGKYLEITKKNIQIIVEKIEYFSGADKKEKWVLKLGDISVDEKRS